MDYEPSQKTPKYNAETAHEHVRQNLSITFEYIRAWYYFPTPDVAYGRPAIMAHNTQAHHCST